MAQAAPQIYDLPQLHRQMIEVLGIKNADKLVPGSEDTSPIDPVSENMNALNLTPIKAFIYQNHEAHIATHQAFIEDPQMAATIGQNPAAQQIVGALQSHIAEHTAFLYRQQIEIQLGQALPAPSEELPEELEVRLAGLQARAAIQLTQEKQAQAAQQQAQEIAEDPLVQMQQRELAIKEQDAQRKAAKDAADTALDQERLGLDKEKAQVTAALEASRIASQNEASEAKNDVAEAKVILEMTKARGEEKRTDAEAHRDASEAYRDDREDR